MEDGAATVDPKEKGAAAAMEDGGAAAAVEKGAAAVDLKKGAATVVEEGRGRALTSSHPMSSLLASSCHRWWAVLTASSDLASSDIASDVLTSSLVRCTRGFRHPHVVALASLVHLLGAREEDWVLVTDKDTGCSWGG
jgi:hypothetical protein